jgi:hypothetical protein
VVRAAESIGVLHSTMSAVVADAINRSPTRRSAAEIAMDNAPTRQVTTARAGFPERASKEMGAQWWSSRKRPRSVTNSVNVQAAQRRADT